MFLLRMLAVAVVADAAGALGRAAVALVLLRRVHFARQSQADGEMKNRVPGVQNGLSDLTEISVSLAGIKMSRADQQKAEPMQVVNVFVPPEQAAIVPIVVAPAKVAVRAQMVENQAASRKADLGINPALVHVNQAVSLVVVPARAQVVAPVVSLVADKRVARAPLNRNQS